MFWPGTNSFLINITVQNYNFCMDDSEDSKKSHRTRRKQQMDLKVFGGRRQGFASQPRMK